VEPRGVSEHGPPAISGQVFSCAAHVPGDIGLWSMRSGVASGPVRTIPEALNRPQLKHRGTIADLYRAESGKVKGAVAHDVPIGTPVSRG